jgi:tripartite-type tricarboxylate transporter receptor subunit TctC
MSLRSMRATYIVLFLALLALAPSLSSAQETYPSRLVKIIVPYAPGGATDIVARVLADQLKNKFSQSFIVENKPGAYGILALQEMARSGADGYTLMIGNVTTNAITPILYASKMPINYEKDVVPIINLVDIPEFFIATAKDFPPKTVAEFIDYAKKNPGKVNYGTVGVGSYPHYDMALFAKRAGDLALTGIPNKAGASGVINDLLTGTVQASFLNVASTAGNVKAGNLRALALVNRTRLAQYPDVPTMQEVGFPGVGTIAWQALFAPAGTPKDVLETLHKAFAEALKAPAVVAAFQQQGFNIVPTDSLDATKTWLATEMANWRKITQEVKIEIPE